jgi:hypothetical protein
MFYLLVNGKHENLIPDEWPSHSIVSVEIRGLRGGGKTGLLTVLFEDEDEFQCKASQSFREVAKEKGFEIKADFIVDAESGKEVGIDEILENHFDSEHTVLIDWPSDEDPQAVEVICYIGTEQRSTVANGSLHLGDFMSQFHDDLIWTGLSSQGKDLDPRLPLLYLCDFLETDRQLEITVDTQPEDFQREYWMPDRAWVEEEEEFDPQLQAFPGNIPPLSLCPIAIPP